MPPDNPVAFVDPREVPSLGKAGPHRKEQNAFYIAKVIVWTFSGAVAALIFLVYWVVMKYPWIDGTSQVSVGKGQGELVYRAVELLTKAAAPALKEFGTFLSTVFGSLLAFILGYYFGEQKNS
jgi:hypothetical protein